MESKTIRTGVQSKKLYLKCTLHTFWRSKEMNTPGHPLFIVFHERTICKLKIDHAKDWISQKVLCRRFNYGCKWIVYYLHIYSG
jgi:hypothetical protein